VLTTHTQSQSLTHTYNYIPKTLRNPDAFWLSVSESRESFESHQLLFNRLILCLNGHYVTRTPFGYQSVSLKSRSKAISYFLVAKDCCTTGELLIANEMLVAKPMCLAYLQETSSQY